jgi:hypothetical protein
MAQFGTSSYGSVFRPLASRGSTGSLAGLINPTAAGLPVGSMYLGTYQAPTFDTPTIDTNQNATPSQQAIQQTQASNYNPASAANGLNFGANGPALSDLSTDPILMQIQAAGQRRVQDASSQALAASENALIGYGGLQGTDSLKALYAADQSNPIYAALLDANTAKAAAANPDSTLKQLANRDLQNIASIDNQRNLQNLYYSSTRANDLSDEATNLRRSENQAATTLAQLLGGQNQNVLLAKQSAEDAYLNGLTGAWDRWLQLQQLLGAPGGGPSTPPSTTTTSGAPNASGSYWNPSQGYVPYTPVVRPGSPWYQ